MDSVRSADVSAQARSVAAMLSVAHRHAPRIRVPDAPHSLAPRRLVMSRCRDAAMPLPSHPCRSASRPAPLTFLHMEGGES